MIKAIIYKVKKNRYGYFFINAMLFFALVFLMDKACGYLLRYYYFKQTSGTFFRTTYSIEKTTAPLLVIGSSRANHHYDPYILSKNFNREAYNTGRDGNYIFYNYAVLQSVLKRYKPEMIIYDFTLSDLQVEPDSYDRLSSLLPYYKTHEEIRPVLALKGKFEREKLISEIYPFNSSLFSIIKGNNPALAQEEAKAKGFFPLYKEWKKPIAPPAHKDNIQELDTTKIKYMEMYLTRCKAAGIKIYIVFSPVFINYNQDPAALKLGRDITKKAQVQFYDFSKDTSFTMHPELFSDPVHLNNKGAEIFSQKISSQILQKQGE